MAPCQGLQARLAQSAERKALNLVVVGSSPTVGAAAKRYMCLTAETCLAQTEANKPGQLQAMVWLNSLLYPGILIHPLPAPLLCPKTTPGGGPHWVVLFVARALLHDRAPISHHSGLRKKKT